MKPGQYFFKLGGFPNSGEKLVEVSEQTNLIENIPNHFSAYSTQSSGIDLSGRDARSSRIYDRNWGRNNPTQKRDGI